jgi:hypothetical protein
VEQIENPMVEFEQGTFEGFEDILRQFDEQLMGPAFVRQYPARRTTDVRVSPKYL